MISKLNLLFCAALLAALLLCSLGAPLQDLSEEQSGEEEDKTSVLLITWKAFADIAKLHKTQSEDEPAMDPFVLESFKSHLFPVKCPDFNSTKEACFKCLAEGLLVYTVFLKHVEKEYPDNTVLSAAKSYSKVLIQMIKKKMRHSDRVTAPTSIQEEQLLKGFNKPGDSFYRKMAAQSILHHLRNFVFDGKRALYKLEARRHMQPNN